MSTTTGFDEADWLAAPFAARAFLLNMLADRLETHKEALFEAIETGKSVKVTKPLHERYRAVKELSDLFSALEQTETAAPKPALRGSRSCCEAGRTAYPAPCPWHDGKRPDFVAAVEATLGRKPATRDQLDDSVPPGLVRYTFELAKQSNEHFAMAQFLADNPTIEVKIRWSA